MPWAETGQASLAQQATSTLWQCQSMKKPPRSQLKQAERRSWKSSSDLAGPLVTGVRGAVHAIDPQRVDVADGAVVDSLDRPPGGPAEVPPHEAGGDLEVLLLRELRGGQQPAVGRGVDGERLLHEDVDALLDRVLEVQRAEGGRGGQHDHVAGAETVDRLPVGVEAQELPLGRHVQTVLELWQLLGEVLEAALNLVSKEVGHGIELDRAAGRREGVGHGAGAARPPPIRASLIVLDSAACTCGTATAAKAEAPATRPESLRNSRRDLLVFMSGSQGFEDRDPSCHIRPPDATGYARPKDAEKGASSGMVHGSKAPGIGNLWNPVRTAQAGLQGDSLPVLQGQAGDPAKLGCVVCHQRHLIGQGDSRNHQIIRPDGNPQGR